MTTRRHALRLLAALGSAALPGVVSPDLARAQGAPEDEDPLAAYMWTARPIVIFANSDKDPRLIHQLREIEQVMDELEVRDVIVIVDDEPGPSRFDTTALRRRLRPHDFETILIGKDGEVKKRSPFPVSGAQLVRLIDRLPIRRQELGRR